MRWMDLNMSNAPMVLPFLNYTRFFVKIKRDFWKKGSISDKISVDSRQLLPEGLRLMGRVSGRGDRDARAHQRKEAGSFAALPPSSIYDSIRHISSQIEVISEGRGIMKTGFRVRSSTERDMLPRNVC